MKYCPISEELCAHSLVKDYKAYACVWDGKLHPFNELKECLKPKKDSGQAGMTHTGGNDGQ